MSSGTILIIEDNDDDVVIIKRALQKANLNNDTHYVTNGQEGLDYLSSVNPQSISLILLDLNMEIMNGFDFLKERSSNDTLKKIPVCVLTSSERPEDIERSYSLGANSYVKKPVEPKEFISTIIDTGHFWINISRRG